MITPKRRKPDVLFDAAVKAKIALLESSLMLSSALEPTMAWKEASEEADREGRWFIMYDHPLLPGWRLNVNDPAARHADLNHLKPERPKHPSARAPTALRGTRHRGL